MKLLQQRLALCMVCIAPLFLSTAKLTATDQPAQADGSHDFDFEVGTWKIHLKKRMHPLSGSDTWVNFDGTSVTRKLWGGRANIEEFQTDSAGGHLEGLTLRLYGPQNHM